jgi:hypothetical protein
MRPTTPNPHDGHHPTAPSSNAPAEEAKTQLEMLTQAVVPVWAQLKPAQLQVGKQENRESVNQWGWTHVERRQAEAKGWQQMKLAGWAVQDWLKARQAELMEQELNELIQKKKELVS